MEMKDDAGKDAEGKDKVRLGKLEADEACPRADGRQGRVNSQWPDAAETKQRPPSQSGRVGFGATGREADEGRQRSRERWGARRRDTKGSTSYDPAIGHGVASYACGREGRSKKRGRVVFGV